MAKKVLAALWLALSAFTINAKSIEAFKFVALGDMPYSISSDYIRFDRLITNINQINQSFTIFIGDIKSGSSPCSDKYNQKIKEYFNQFSSPLIYSIGDNEWTDCHRVAAGGFNPLERLASIREDFLATLKALEEHR